MANTMGPGAMERTISFETTFAWDKIKKDVLTNHRVVRFSRPIGSKFKFVFIQSVLIFAKRPFWNQASRCFPFWPSEIISFVPKAIAAASCPRWSQSLLHSDSCPSVQVHCYACRTDDGSPHVDRHASGEFESHVSIVLRFPKHSALNIFKG